MVKLVGYSRFKSKAQKDLCVASCVVSLSERDKDYGRIGEKVKELFVPTNQFNLLTPSDVGKLIEVEYDEGYIVSIKVLAK